MDDNAYCARLGIAIPDLRAIVGRHKKVKLFHFMVVALVEHGGPMSLTEIAQRLYEVCKRRSNSVPGEGLETPV